MKRRAFAHWTRLASIEYGFCLVDVTGTPFASAKSKSAWRPLSVLASPREGGRQGHERESLVELRHAPRDDCFRRLIEGLPCQLESHLAKESECVTWVPRTVERTHSTRVSIRNVIYVGRKELTPLPVPKEVGGTAVSMARVTKS
jgi:hypothetical protein